ncbi:MAG TPA: hypothetical protein VK770_01885 [Candidatus Acidoferrum sp.]|jgi:hypothetical protein|nr:hypothetical protein [Candidatus Acidoferrum sp.]
MNVCGREIRVHGRLIRIARLDAEKYHFLEDPQPLLDGLRKCGTRVDLFTFMQRVQETEPKYSYPMEWDNFAALPVSTFDHWWNKQLGFKARNKAKQAEKKGVVIREVPFDDALLHGIWKIYNECPVRQGRPFSHYGKNLETVRREEATYLDSSVFIAAFLGDEIIGFIKMVSDETRSQAGLMNIVSMIQHRDKAPTNALVAQAVRSCADRGISHLVYANFAYGKKQPDSVADFKERNGFLQINVPRYFVPLTAIGRAALRLRLHHPLVDLVPEPLVAKLRGYRNAWYGRKFQSAAEAS